MLVSKEDLSFGDRSWRYSAYIENGIVVKHFVEEEVAGDPFEVSDADTMIKHINPEFVTEDDILIFTKENCSYCHELKQILKEKRLKYTEIPLNNEVRNKVLRAMSPDDLVVPQVFVNGKRYSGLENFKKAS